MYQANNRQHSSTALRTTDMWSNVIGDAFGKANDVAQVHYSFTMCSHSQSRAVVNGHLSWFGERSADLIDIWGARRPIASRLTSNVSSSLAKKTLGIPQPIY